MILQSTDDFRQAIRTGLRVNAVLRERTGALRPPLVADRWRNGIRETCRYEIRPSPLPPMGKIERVAMDRLIAVIWRKCHAWMLSM